VELLLSGHQTRIVVFLGKDDSNYLLRIQAHLWVKRQPCRGYGCMLVVVALRVVSKFTLNMPSFLCVLRFPFLKMRLSFWLYPITREINNIMTCGIFLNTWKNLNYSESFSLNGFWPSVCKFEFLTQEWLLFMITVKVLLNVINDCSPSGGDSVVITPHLNYLPLLHSHISTVIVELSIYEGEDIFHIHWYIIMIAINEKITFLYASVVLLYFLFLVILFQNLVKLSCNKEW